MAARRSGVLSMLADFTALPAALWILFRARPDATPPRRVAGRRAALLDQTLKQRLGVRAFTPFLYPSPYSFHRFGAQVGSLRAVSFKPEDLWISSGVR
ncbi:MAG: hypothetical protein M3436_14730 [Pseudomonadota bacterium]|nr:hypothetical protein [Pseudomonadota bacterium]